MCMQSILEIQSVVQDEKCNLFNDRFEYLGRDIMTARNTTSKSKYGLVKSWKGPKKGDNLWLFVSFCNVYARFVLIFQIQCKPLQDLYIQCRKREIPDDT